MKIRWPGILNNVYGASCIGKKVLISLNYLVYIYIGSSTILGPYMYVFVFTIFILSLFLQKELWIPQILKTCLINWRITVTPDLMLTQSVLDPRPSLHSNHFSALAEIYYMKPDPLWLPQQLLKLKVSTYSSYLPSPKTRV